ncbi:MAG TPA: TraR/DksA family transcriptional regulator [Pyrinomonadaceae bacterium]|nr:TraR/DksA family transcriptional regulator [Pyrinomonadaceae bacterium]
MDADRLNHFRELLLAGLRQHNNNVLTEQAAALDMSDDGVQDNVDLSLIDVNTELAFSLGERESQMVADIDQALLRIKEGIYGICARCGKHIDERRLEAMPTARYDASCQAELEQRRGMDMPTL